MVGALTFLLTSCLLQGFLCQGWKVNVPRTIKVIRGSCVTIPCSFHIDSEHDGNLNHTCGAIWKKKDNAVVFNSSEINQLKGELKGILKEKDCTTTLNMVSGGNGSYYFRLECNNALKYTFFQDFVWISVKDDLPPPTLTPSTLKVKEGTSVSLTCSAPAPCLPHPPTLTWTPKLGGSQESLQENQDKTKVQTSVLTFTPSYLHHGQKISCTAVYEKQDGSKHTSPERSLTAHVSCAQCKDWKVNVPRAIEVMRGSCVTIPCSFHIDSEHDGNLNHTCGAIWKKKDNAVVFNSSEINQLKGELKGILKEKDCTTTLNMLSGGNGSYYFRLECNNALKYNFHWDLVWISVKDDLPPPTLTPSTLKVKEGTSVNLTCSAPAPCLPHPPSLTWTPKLGESQETLQENQDKTKVQTSVLTFTASHLHHGQKISCTAVYGKLDGSNHTSLKGSLTAHVSYSPKNTTVSVSPSCPVPENNNVTLTCSSDANPPVKNYTWYRADGDQETLIGTGPVLNITVNQDGSYFFCKAENEQGVGHSDKRKIDVQCFGSNNGILPWVIAGLSVAFSVIGATVYIYTFVCKTRHNENPKESERTYMSLDRRDVIGSSDYEVIAQPPR